MARHSGFFLVADWKDVNSGEVVFAGRPGQFTSEPKEARWFATEEEAEAARTSVWSHLVPHPCANYLPDGSLDLAQLTERERTLVKEYEAESESDAAMEAKAIEQQRKKLSDLGANYDFTRDIFELNGRYFDGKGDPMD